MKKLLLSLGLSVVASLGAKPAVDYKTEYANLSTNERTIAVAHGWNKTSGCMKQNKKISEECFKQMVDYANSSEGKAGVTALKAFKALTGGAAVIAFAYQMTNGSNCYNTDAGYRGATCYTGTMDYLKSEEGKAAVTKFNALSVSARKDFKTCVWGFCNFNLIEKGADAAATGAEAVADLLAKAKSGALRKAIPPVSISDTRPESTITKPPRPEYLKK